MVNVKINHVCDSDGLTQDDKFGVNRYSHKKFSVNDVTTQEKDGAIEGVVRGSDDIQTGKEVHPGLEVFLGCHGE